MRNCQQVFFIFPLARDQVEGASFYPLGYAEGIFTVSSFRGKQVARRLINEGEKWCLRQGCRELASYVELSN